MRVEQINPRQATPLLIDVHYAGRLPSISTAFALIDKSDLLGVCTFGTPSSSPLRRGVCGDEYSDRVIELNRLCFKDNKPNQASMLVGASLRMLPKPAIVVSYADKAHDHVGIVYQATNFLYCGLSAKRTDWKVKGKEHLHGQSIADEFRGVKNRAAAMREKYGDDFYLEERSRKHRYVYFTGTKRDKKNMRAALKYNVEEYPKC